MSKEPEIFDNSKDVDESLTRLNQKIDAILNRLILFFVKHNIKIPFLLPLETTTMDQKSSLSAMELPQKSGELPKNESSYSTLENKIDKLTSLVENLCHRMDKLENEVNILKEKNEKLEKRLSSSKSTDSSSEEEMKEEPLQFRRRLVRNVVQNVQEDVFEEIQIQPAPTSKSLPTTPTFLTKEKLKSKEYDAEEGFYDTVFYGFPCRKNKRSEEELKELAYEGKTALLLKKLNFKSVDVNGRGMPDSICSMYNEFNDKTALMLAAEKGHVDCVRVLISKGALVNLLDRNGNTAMDFAHKNRHRNVIDLLHKYGGLDGEKYKSEFNALHQVKTCQ